MSEAAERALERNLARSEDELAVELGLAVGIEEGLGAFATRAELIAAAEAWLARQQSRLAGALCPHPTVRAFARPGVSTDRELFIALFDVVATLQFGVKAPVGTLTSLLMRKGLTRLCGPGWPPAA